MQNFKVKIPNIITTCRIILLIPIVIVMLIHQLTNNILYSFSIGDINISFNLGYIIALILFLIASISDFFDGYLARKWNVVSVYGKIIDPIADKILINSIFIILAVQHKVLLPLVILMIIRDIVMDGIRIYAIGKNIEVAANFYGKMKTFVQIFAIIFILLISSNNIELFPKNNWWFYAIQNLFIYISTLFSLLSFWVYIKNFYVIDKKTI